MSRAMDPAMRAVHMKASTLFANARPAGSNPSLVAYVKSMVATIAARGRMQPTSEALGRSARAADLLAPPLKHLSITQRCMARCVQWQS